MEADVAVVPPVNATKFPVAVPTSVKLFGGSRRKSSAAGFTEDGYGYAVDADKATTSVKVVPRSRASVCRKPNGSVERSPPKLSTGQGRINPNNRRELNQTRCRVV